MSFFNIYTELWLGYEILFPKFIYYMWTKMSYRVAKQYQNHPFNLQPNQLRQINLSCNLYKENHCTN